MIPKQLTNKEIAHTSLSIMHVVDSMQERKSLMAELSDAFIVCPGGLGTLEEIFEVWNAAKIGLHHKPIYFLNVNHFFDPLFAFINSAKEQGFITEFQRDLVHTINDPAELVVDLVKALG